jgi:hypothetical protein
MLLCCREQIRNLKKDKTDATAQRNLMLLTLKLVDHAAVHPARQNVSDRIML